jgi:hypothetical protein
MRLVSLWPKNRSRPSRSRSEYGIYLFGPLRLRIVYHQAGAGLRCVQVTRGEGALHLRYEPA